MYFCILIYSYMVPSNMIHMNEYHFIVVSNDTLNLCTYTIIINIVDFENATFRMIVFVFC